MKHQKKCTRSALLKKIRRAVKKWLNEGRGELREVITEVGNTIQLAIVSRPTKRKYQMGLGIVSVAPELKPLQRSDILRFFERLQRLFHLSLQPAVQKAKKVVCSFILPTTPTPA